MYKRCAFQVVGKIYATLNNIDYKLRCHQWNFFDKLNYSKTNVLSILCY